MRVLIAVSLCLSSILGLSSVLAVSTAEAAPRQSPGSRIVVDLPDTYVPLPVGAGFLNLTTEVAVVAFDRPYKQCTPEGLAMPRRQLEDGLADVSQGKLARTEPHVYLTGRKTAESKRQFIVSFCGPASGAVLLVEVPEAALTGGKITTAEIERILTSATAAEKPAAVVERYRLTELGPFKPVRSKALAGPLRFYSLDGTTKGGGPKHEPLLMVMHMSEPGLQSPEQRARQSLAEAGTDVQGAPETRNLTIDELDAVEMVARVRDSGTGKTVLTVTVWLANEKKEMFGLTGFAPEDQAAIYLPVFRKIAEGFRLVR